MTFQNNSILEDNIKIKDLVIFILQSFNERNYETLNYIIQYVMENDTFLGKIIFANQVNCSSFSISSTIDKEDKLITSHDRSTINNYDDFNEKNPMLNNLEFSQINTSNNKIRNSKKSRLLDFVSKKDSYKELKEKYNIYPNVYIFINILEIEILYGFI
jgi:hypothetical protein